MKRIFLSMLLLAGCREAGFVRALQIENRSQAIGGPSALADLGDFVLENDQIRVAILQGKNSLGPGVFGGSLVDADLRRPESEFRGGNGLDQNAVKSFAPGLKVPFSHSYGRLRSHQCMPCSGLRHRSKRAPV